MDYLNNDHVISVFFYGSFLTSYNTAIYDIDIYIIFDDEDPNRLVRGNKIIDGTKIGYFEKPISDISIN